MYCNPRNTSSKYNSRLWINQYLFLNPDRYMYVHLLIFSNLTNSTERFRVLKQTHVWFGLVGFYGTGTLYRLYRAGECVVNVRVSECVELVEVYYTTPPVGSYHLAHSSNGWILLLRFHWGNVPIPLYTPEQWAYSIPHMGQIRHYDVTRNLSNSIGEYAVWMRVSACRCQMGSHPSTLSSSGWIISPPQSTWLHKLMSHERF